MSTWFDMDGPVDSIAIDDRGLQYGDGLFETIAVRNGAPRLWEQHMRRLQSSCERLSIPFPGTGALAGLLERAVAASERAGPNATAKLIVTTGVGERGYARPADPTVTVRVGVFPYRGPDETSYADGVDVVVCDTRLAEQAALAGMKTLNRLEQVLGRQEIGEAFEGIMCDLADRVICGTMSNVIIATKDRIATPALERCGVEGVTRAEILERARDTNLDIEVCDITLSECLESEELILANSQFGVLRARSIAGKVFNDTDQYRRLRELLGGAGFSELDQ